MQNDNPATNSSGELDLLEIVVAVWQQKWLVFLTMVAVGCLAAAYAFLSTPIYESKYYVSPPTVNDIANLNYGRTSDFGLQPFTVAEVYKNFLRNLQSESQRRSFFENVYLPGLGESAAQLPRGVSYDRFSTMLTITPVGKDEEGRWSVSLQDPDASHAMKWVDQYVTQVAESTKRELAKNATKEALVRARNIELKIATLKESGSKVREDAISNLREALVVAKASGLESSLVFSGNGPAKLAGGMSEDSTYLRGSKAIEAELKNLENRQSDDPFIPGLRKLQARYDVYKQLSTEVFDIAVFRQDGVLDQPVSPIKPKKFLILVLGLVVGGLLGSAIALLRRFVINRKPI
jgi:chain length determinant protein (polysaccharide antigen chain regulator)